MRNEQGLVPVMDLSVAEQRFLLEFLRQREEVQRGCAFLLEVEADVRRQVSEMLEGALAGDSTGGGVIAFGHNWVMRGEGGATGQE